MTNDLDERLSRRFEDDESDTEDEESQTSLTSETSESSQSSRTERNERPSQKAQKAQNVKKEWNVRSVYLNDELDSQLMTAFKRLDLELSEADAQVDLKKTRHFYPLIVELGLERLEAMEVTEITERLEDS